jgi:CDGSH-type Zn-finger protein
VSNIKIKPSIKLTKNGPYIVKDLNDFKNSKNEDISIKSIMTLCRCGGSQTKPFCDGTHLNNGFKDNKESDRQPDRLDNYDGRDITIHDNRGVCSHRGHCTDNLPKVFKMNYEPWIDPNAESAQNVARVIRLCPSGALSFTKDGMLYKDIDREPKIIISKNGPYDIQGFIIFDDPENIPESNEHFTLCRCGHSNNKPFCSGQHWYVKFNDPKN